MNTRERLLNRIERAWRELGRSYAGLDESDLLKGGIAGDWSVRDIIAHVTTWEQEALKYLPLLIRGERTPRYSDLYGGIDAFNALTTAQNRELAFSEVLSRRDAVHQQLIDFVLTIPEAHLGSNTRVRRRLHADTHGHYLKHAAAIRKWRGAAE